MRFTLLGTGTSQGIPVIGCDCDTCRSKDPRDNRTRTSALIQSEQSTVVIDVGPDFRQQMLREKVRDVDAVLITHEHNDHIIGLDDLRPLMFKNGRPMLIYAEQRVLDDIRLRFDYAFHDHGYPGAPSFELVSIEPGQILTFGGITVKAIRVFHGDLPILGFTVMDRIGYFTDTNNISETIISELINIPIFIIDMLHLRKHHSHNNLDSAMRLIKSVRAQKSYLIHMSHYMGPTRSWEHLLPPDVYASYDGLFFEI